MTFGADYRLWYAKIPHSHKNDVCFHIFLLGLLCYFANNHYLCPDFNNNHFR